MVHNVILMASEGTDRTEQELTTGCSISGWEVGELGWFIKQGL